jgi:hypothetical protein
MTKEAEGKAQQSNVIYFRPKRAAFKLPVEPSREDLAFDWTLSDADKGRAFDHRGDDNQLRYAVQLCVLRKYGRFLDQYTDVPGNVLGYLCTQLEMAPVSELSNDPRPATESQYRRDICQYLAYGPFDASAKDHLERWFLEMVSETLYLENPIENVEDMLRRRRVVIPAPGHLERIVNCACARAKIRCSPPSLNRSLIQSNPPSIRF